jgi:hypothetical protein
MIVIDMNALDKKLWFYFIIFFRCVNDLEQNSEY